MVKSQCRLVIDLRKAQSVADSDGVLTPQGMAVAHDYAKQWVQENSRSLELERQYPELAGLFYDIRADVACAEEHAGK